MVKKVVAAVIVIIILGISSFFVIEYIRYKKSNDPNKIFLLPKLEFAGVEVKTMNADSSNIIVRLGLKNQLPFGFKADSLNYKFFIDDVEVLKSRQFKSVSIKANDVSTLELPIRSFNNKLISILGKDERKHVDSVNYRAEISFVTKIVFTKKIHLNITKRLPLIYLPKVTDAHLHIRSINFGRAEVDLLIKIENKNKVTMGARQIDYRFSIEDRQWIKGSIPGLTEIKAQNVTELKIPLRISFKQVRRSLFDLLKKGEKIPYNLELDMTVASPDKMIRNSHIRVVSKGSLKSLLQAEKAAKKDMKK